MNRGISTLGCLCLFLSILNEVKGNVRFTSKPSFRVFVVVMINV